MAHALASRSALALSLPRGGSSRRKSRGCRPAVPRAGLNTDKSYNCVVNKEGVIISEDIPSGTYEVSAWWAGATGSSDEGDATLAPRCDSENQRGCEVRCEMTAEGELVCEGLESGTYRVINAKEAEANCEVEDGAFECVTSFDEDDAGPIVQDVGDLNLVEDEDHHGIRLGG